MNSQFFTKNYNYKQFKENISRVFISSLNNVMPSTPLKVTLVSKYQNFYILLLIVSICAFSHTKLIYWDQDKIPTQHTSSLFK